MSNSNSKEISTSHLLQATNLHKSYKTSSQLLNVLSGASLKLKAGEMLGIIGASGVGKSTLLHVLGGLDHPQIGQVLFHGDDIYSKGSLYLENFRNRKVGFVFQFFNLMPTLTVMENVELPLLLAHSSRSASERIKTLLNYVGLWHRANSFPAELSGGEMQRVAIARSLVHQPVILLADEPTGNLDSENGLKIIDLMRKAAIDFKTTVVMVTHNPQVAAIGNRHFEIRDGKLTDQTV